MIETSGEEIIVHKRTDLDANTAKARMVALADNRTTEINLAWDASEFRDLLQETQDVKNFFADSEIDTFLPDADDDVNGLFEPTLNPTQGAGQSVTDEKIDQMQDNMNNQFVDAGAQNLCRIECPHCGENFSVDRDAL